MFGRSTDKLYEVTMSKPVQPFAAFLALAILILACAVPLPQVPPTLTTGTTIPPASPNPNDLGTTVAGTLTASVSTPGAGSPTTTAPTARGTIAATISATAPTDGSTASLPGTFYYLAPDSAGLLQVFRLERDGTTQRQITSESASVSDYDVS